MALTAKAAAEYQIKETKDIKCPKITINITVDFDPDDIFDQAKYAHYNKSAQAWLDKNLAERVKQFDGPIKDAQKRVDKMKAMIDELKKYLENPKNWVQSVKLHKRWRSLSRN